MDRADFVLDLIRTRNVVAVSALVALSIASRVVLGNRLSVWLVLLFGVLVVVLGFALSRLAC